MDVPNYFVFKHEVIAYVKDKGYSFVSGTLDDNSLTFLNIEKGLLFTAEKTEMGSYEGTLSHIFVMIDCSIHHFSLPNKNFEVFEKHIMGLSYTNPFTGKVYHVTDNSESM